MNQCYCCCLGRVYQDGCPPSSNQAALPPSWYSQLDIAIATGAPWAGVVKKRPDLCRIRSYVTSGPVPTHTSLLHRSGVFFTTPVSDIGSALARFPSAISPLIASAAGRVSAQHVSRVTSPAARRMVPGEDGQPVPREVRNPDTLGAPHQRRAPLPQA